MFNKEELVPVDCFYYIFYIKKSELHKYNISSEQLDKSTKKIINENKKVNIKPVKKIKYINSCKTLILSRVLQELNSYYINVSNKLVIFKNSFF